MNERDKNLPDDTDVLDEDLTETGEIDVDEDEEEEEHSHSH